jgi:hypothetical protein
VSLTARDNRALAGMRAAFCLSDPALVALFGMFNRLEAGEPMPRLERVHRRSRRLLCAAVALLALCARRGARAAGRAWGAGRRAAGRAGHAVRRLARALGRLAHGGVSRGA